VVNVAVVRADPLEVLRRRTSEKWGTYPAEVLPMFVAEMDFPLAPAIKAALHEAIECGDTGYVNPHDTAARDAFARDRGETYPEADALRTAQFFMLGLYAVLITSHGHSRAARAEILDNFVATVLRSVAARLKTAASPP
jgi:bifunctional pyridoxal-dependent enzyme with beta-cystathionase and maltose regulon repressor activities